MYHARIEPSQLQSLRRTNQAQQRQKKYEQKIRRMRRRADGAGGCRREYHCKTTYSWARCGYFAIDDIFWLFDWLGGARCVQKRDRRLTMHATSGRNKIRCVVWACSHASAEFFLVFTANFNSVIDVVRAICFFLAKHTDSGEKKVCATKSAFDMREIKTKPT